MEEKYYTPKLEEFHVGFEYEYSENNSSDIIPTWKKYNLSFNDLIASKPELCTHDGENFIETMFNKENSLRVKYLDQSDIESLGWENKQYVPERNICLNFEYKDWSLTYWIQQVPYVEISRDDYDTGCALYIRNKSELIKIMKQLNIQNENIQNKM